MLLVCRHLGKCIKVKGALLLLAETNPSSRGLNKIFRFFSIIDISPSSFSLCASPFLLKEDEQVLHLAQWSHNESDWNSVCYSLLITTPFTPSMYQFLTPALHVWERKIDQGKRKHWLHC